MVIGILGPPGCGKGTQSERIQRTFHFAHLSSGGILRDEIRQQTPLGRLAGELMSHGNLVPDPVINEVMVRRLKSTIDHGDGVLLDGYPRTVPQLRHLIGKLEAWAVPLNAMLYLQIDDDSLVERLTGRRICGTCGAVYHLLDLPPTVPNRCDKCNGELIIRPDDAVDAIRERMRVYHNETEPILAEMQKEHYFYRIPAEGNPETVFHHIRQVLEPLMHGSPSTL
ncbi:MAG TPA: nucleoside monophosphate kinase [Candidatus Sumerlaeota bacterium]|nr:nucleoside monophosphate kinase [Candidatus Sumerlaeota bacterium]HOR27543.1 nucleoside monophosphate kinase [Candidatus Sumerlaeota bacterium]